MSSASRAGETASPEATATSSWAWLTGSAAFGGLASAGVAAVAGLCCLGPATVLLLGAGGAVAAAGLKPYRIPLLVLSAALIGVGFWRTRRATMSDAKTCSPSVGRWIRGSLTVAGVAWIAAATLWLAQR